MLRVNQLDGFGARPGGGSAIAVLRKLGLTGGLQLCLDAGDGASYPGSGQTWFDLSGNGYDFNRGATSGSEGSDPAFNGTAGRLSSGEYWSFDGGDYFRYDTTNETWMQNLHKAGAKWTAIGWIRTSLTVSTHIFGTSQAGAGNIGAAFRGARGPGGELAVFISDGSGALALNVGSTMAVAANVWTMVAVSLDEAAGAAGSFFARNHEIETFNGAYNTPSASNATFTMELAAWGNAGQPATIGARMAMVAMWEGVALTRGQVLAVFNALRWRFGV